MSPNGLSMIHAKSTGDRAAWVLKHLSVLVMLQAVKRLLRNCSSRDVTLFEVEGGYHELFMGPEKDVVMQRMIQWVLQHAELASPAASNAAA